MLDDAAKLTGYAELGDPDELIKHLAAARSELMQAREALLDARQREALATTKTLGDDQ